CPLATRRSCAPDYSVLDEIDRPFRGSDAVVVSRPPRLCNEGRRPMLHAMRSAAIAGLALLATGSAFAQAPSATPPAPPPAAAPAGPPIETPKADATDNVYISRNGGHQSMFIVTKAGVIATDPIAYGRPTGGKSYVDEIKKVTSQP